MRVELDSTKELSEMHRMGHTCANLNGELFFIWGGSAEDGQTPTTTNNRANNISNSPANRDSHLWILETLSGYWRHRTCSGECPPYLSGTTSSLIGQKMFVFGGHSTAHDNWLNSLYCLDLETFKWKDLGSQAKAEPTKPIRSDKCVSWSHDGRFYVFGGYGWSQIEHLLQLLDKQKDLQLMADFRWPKFGWNNQLVEFDPRLNTWRWPSYSGKCPSARAAHSGALMGSKYYLFGGRDSRERLNDLYTLDLVTFEWTQIASFSSPDHIVSPIRHLLEPANSFEENPARQFEVVQEDIAEVIAEANETQVVEELTPSPSSSSEPIVNQQFISLSSDEEDEEGDYRFEYPHPSHILERWSLSSRQSASSSSNIDINCQLDRYQDENDGPATNMTQSACDQQLDATATSRLENSFVVDEHDSNGNNDQVHPPSPQPSPNHFNEISHQAIDDQSMAEETPVIAPVPAGRSFASFTPISDQQILLYGGVSSENINLDDCWVLNTKDIRWTQVNPQINLPRLWHTGSRTKGNEVVIIGGSSSDRVDEYCTDVVTLSLEPKSLKRLALDTAARSIRMRSINRTKGLPSIIGKLIKLRKQAIALTMRSNHQRLP